MSFKNIFYDQRERKIHLWTDDGYQVFPYQDYGYILSLRETKYKSIFGDNVAKVPLQDLEHFVGKVFESDVKPEIRTLVDMYHDNDEIAKTISTMVIDIETEISKTKGYSHPPECNNEITAITCIMLETGEKKTLLVDPNNRYKNTYGYDFVETFPNEWSLLKRFLRYLREINPDILVGWNSNAFDIPYIYVRLFKTLGLRKANLLSPIQNCYYNIRKNKVRIAGISCMDYMLLYKKYTQNQRSSYSLKYISEMELGETKIEYDGNLQTLYETDIDKYVYYNVTDVDLIVKLENKLKFLNKAITLAHLGNVPYEDVMSSVMHSEGLFLTETKRMNLVCPNKPEVIVDDDVQDTDKDKIVGAFVKDSKRGRYEFTYDEDLTSLYPMIAVTLNISPESKFAMIRDYIDVWQEKDKTKFKINYDIFDPSEVAPDPYKEINVIVDLIGQSKSLKIKTMGGLKQFMDEYNLTMSGNGVFYKKDNMGIIPIIILKYFGKRKEYKDLRDEAIVAGNKELEEYYDQMQWSYKIIINALYGVLANKYFRFFDKDNAQSITLTGRFTNMTGMDVVFKYHKKLLEKNTHPIDDEMIALYNDPILTGDTDSIIMSAVPVLHSKYGEYWKDIPEEQLLDNTLKLSIFIANKINKRMNHFATNWLNSDKNYLSFKQEWVGRVGFYTGMKKRYANKIVIQEGIKKEKLDIKGLDIVRSSFPKDCQNFMRNILTKILSFETKEQIDEYILDFYDKLKNIEYSGVLRNEKDFDIFSLSTISSVNKYKDYVDEEYLEYRKGTPVAVKSAVHYNKFLKINNLDSEFQKISIVDKIAWVYIQSNNYGFPTMGLPLDHRIPDELVEFVYETANINKAIESLLYKKVKLYYDAMGWEEAQKTANDIFSIF
jgi:DNA polymerase elongation subunit (family B)